MRFMNKIPRKLFYVFKKTLNLYHIFKFFLTKSLLTINSLSKIVKAGIFRNKIWLEKNHLKNPFHFSANNRGKFWDILYIVKNHSTCVHRLQRCGPCGSALFCQSISQKYPSVQEAK